MNIKSIVKKIENVPTPFYYYDTELLRATLQTVKLEIENDDNMVVHYAIKANSSKEILKEIASAGFGADCVSGGEIQECIEAGFPTKKIVFAGVGKLDWEINLAIDNDIEAFNVESLPELEVINELAAKKGKTARVAFRINPDVDAHTHVNITTGLNENKFGISMEQMLTAIRKAEDMSNVDYIGLHFHIGSQIQDLECFRALCSRINQLQEKLEAEGVVTRSINVGGGLGIDYVNPNIHSIANFKEYFKIFRKNLKLRSSQTLHFELGRSIVAQCGYLISKVIYIKQGVEKQFAIIDAGFTDLIRPALYQAHHKIENLSSTDSLETYDIVGPICESSDVFEKEVQLNKTKRGDCIAIHSAGAYGEVMASTYNSRSIIKGYTTENLP